MYWNNPLEQYVWPCDSDPVQRGSHGSRHCLFWDPTLAVRQISTNQTLQDICDWAMQWLTQDGLDAFLADHRNHYDIANLVKLNMWIEDIRQQGIVKPWLVLDPGDGTHWAGTGDSRMRCLTVLPHITTVAAFVSTHRDRAALPAAAPAPVAAAAPAEPAVQPIAMVDVMTLLTEKAAKHPEKLNWKTSIVDLLKLLGLDSSLAARKELAKELYCPDELMGDSAKMNMWLHKNVLGHIAANGGNVPKELL